MTSSFHTRDVRLPIAAGSRRSSVSHLLVVGCSLALLGISIAHSLEDFVYGIPARFHLTVIVAALVLGAAYIVQVSILLLAANGRRMGYLLTGLTGAGWALAAAVDHLGEVLTVSPYREGALSKALEVGIMVVGILLAGVSAWAFRAAHQHSRPDAAN